MKKILTAGWFVVVFLFVGWLGSIAAGALMGLFLGAAWFVNPANQSDLGLFQLICATAGIIVGWKAARRATRAKPVTPGPIGEWVN